LKALSKEQFDNGLEVHVVGKGKSDSFERGKFSTCLKRENLLAEFLPSMVSRNSSLTGGFRLAVAFIIIYIFFQSNNIRRFPGR